jgi:hypothetical protein
MTEHTASRTLVKSPPELWAECSDAAALTRHLDQFGDIKITRLEPETAIAWEGEQVRGTVRLEPSGWGTKVTLTAELEEVAGGAVLEPVAPEPAAVEPEPASVAVERVAVEPETVAVEPEPVAVAPRPKPVAPRPEKRPGWFGRVVAMLVGSAEPEPELVLRELTAEPEPEVVAEPDVIAEPESDAVAESDVVAEPEAVAVRERESKPEAVPLSEELADAELALVAALESLGQAHHRPFSRA